MMDEGDIEQARHRMTACVARYSETMKRDIEIVFDGRTGHFSKPYRKRFTRGGVKITFTGRGQKADERIINRVNKAKNPGNITVVTSDREIRNSVRTDGGRVMESADFRNRMLGRLRRREKELSEPGKPAVKGISYEEYMNMLEEHEKDRKEDI